MAIDLLQQILGGGQQQDYQDFLRRYQQNPAEISDAEAAQRYRELMRNAPAGVAADAHAQALSRLSAAERGKLAEQYQQAHDNTNSPFDGFVQNDPSDPANLGRMAHQAEQQDPDLFDKVFGQGSPLGGTLGKMVLAGVAAYMASRVLGNNQGRTSQPQPSSGGLGGLLDALAGGGAAPQQPSQQREAPEPGIHVKGSKQNG